LIKKSGLTFTITVQISAANTNLSIKEQEYVVRDVITDAKRRRYRALTHERLLMPTYNHGTVNFSHGQFVAQFMRSIL
jgi:hypothetical protein